jgi:hypothetical protein
MMDAAQLRHAGLRYRPGAVKTSLCPARLRPFVSRALKPSN